MTKENAPTPDAISASFQRLSAAATALNLVSDELGKSICTIDEVLQALGLGISKWELIDEYSDGDSFSRKEIGYAKVGSKWGVALRTVAGNEYAREDAHVEQYLFNEAPRRLRVEGITKIADLLDGLTQEATRVAEDIKAKVGQAQEVSSTLMAAFQAGVRARALASATRRK